MQRFVLAVGFAICAGPVVAQGIGGSYSVEGANFNGVPYEGTAEITLTSDVTCEIVWTTGPSVSAGICMRDGNAFTAAYELQGKVGLIIYMVQDDGSLVGSWTIAGTNAVGTEVLTPM